MQGPAVPQAGRRSRCCGRVTRPRSEGPSAGVGEPAARAPYEIGACRAAGPSHLGHSLREPARWKLEEDAEHLLEAAEPRHEAWSRTPGTAPAASPPRPCQVTRRGSSGTTANLAGSRSVRPSDVVARRRVACVRRPSRARRRKSDRGPRRSQRRDGRSAAGRCHPPRPGRRAPRASRPQNRRWPRPQLPFHRSSCRTSPDSSARGTSGHVPKTAPSRRASCHRRQSARPSSSSENIVSRGHDRGPASGVMRHARFAHGPGGSS